MKHAIGITLGIGLAIVIAQRAQAGSATWDVDGSANWSVNGNWNPTTGYPNGTSDTATLGSKITSDATLTLTENISFNTLTFNDNNQYTISGAFTLTPNNTAGDAIVHNNTGNAVIASDLAFGAANRSLGGTSTATQTWSGVLSGSAFISKNSSDTLILSGSSANTYSGRFFLNAGTVIMNKPAGTAAFASSGNSIDVGFGAATDELRWMASDQIGDTRAVTVNAAGLLNLNGYSDNTGTLTINGGTISNGTFGATGVIGAGGTISANLILNLGAFTAVRATAGNTLTISGNVSGQTMGLDSSHAGMVVLTGSNTQNGIDLTAGTLVLGSDTAVGTNQLQLKGGTIRAQGTRTITNLVRLTWPSPGIYPTNTFAGSDALTFTGPVSLDVDRTLDVTNGTTVKFTGNWTVAAGTPSLTKIGGGAVAMGGASIDIVGNVVVKDGALQLDGKLTAQSSTLTVTNTGVLSGTGVIQRATSVVNGGALAPGSPVGVLTLTNATKTCHLTLGPDAVLTYDCGATSDRVDVYGNLTLDGTINLTNAVPIVEGTYRIFNYSGTLTDNGLAVGVFPPAYNGWSATVNTATAKQVNLIILHPRGTVIAIR